MAIFYISPTGSDSNPGTLAQPWLTPNKAFSSAPVGSIIRMRSGLYIQNGLFVPARGAIRFENAPGEQVILRRTTVSTTGYMWNMENTTNFELVADSPGSIIVEQASGAGSFGTNSLMRLYSTNTTDGSWQSKSHLFQNILFRGINGRDIETRYVDTISVLGCEFTTSAIGCTVYNTKNMIIDGNVFHDMNRMLVNNGSGDAGATGVSLEHNTYNTHVQNNLFYNCYADSAQYVKDGGAIEFFGNHHCYIHDNVAHDNEGFIETGASDATFTMDGNEVYRNLVYGQTSFDTVNYDTPAVFFRGGINQRWYKNTFVVGKGGGVFLIQRTSGGFATGINNLEVKDNILVSTDVDAPVYLLFDNQGTNFAGANLQLDYNLAWNTASSSAIVAVTGGYNRTQKAAFTSTYGWEQHGVWANPSFVNLGANDYHLQAGSPAIDAGIVRSPYTEGFSGGAPDIGVYEFSGVSTWRKNAQAQALITRPPSREMSAQAQARIRSFGASKQGQARTVILSFLGLTKIGQAQALIKTSSRATGQAAGQILSQTKVKNGQANALIQSLFGLRSYGQARAEIYSPITRVHGTAMAQIDPQVFPEPPPTPEPIPSESITGDIESIYHYAKTVLLSADGKFADLYVDYSDRHRRCTLVKVDRLKTAKDNRHIAKYTVTWECEPWEIGDDEIIIPFQVDDFDTDIVGRTFNDGGWTPVTFSITGTNITISGYSETESFTGFISVDGTVTGLVIDSEAITATMNGENANDRMLWKDYAFWLAPGKNYFVVENNDETTAIVVSYHNRWY